MMKKLCSLMLALMMVLFAVPSLAETADPAPASFGLTFEARITLNEEAVTQLAGSFGAEGMDEVIAKAVSILNNLSIRASVDGMAAQGEILLKDQPLVTIAGKLGEDGVKVVTDVLPSHVLVLGGDVVNDAMGKMNEILDGLNSGELSEAIAKYIQPLTEGLAEKIGEPEAVSYTFEGVEFTVKTPINVTAKEIEEKLAEAMKGILSEKSVTELLGKFGVGAEKIDEIIADLEKTAEEKLPELTMALYSNEAGDTLADISAVQDEQSATMQIGSIGGKYALRAAAPQMTMSLDADPAAGVVNSKMEVEAEGMKVAEEESMMIADNMLNGISNTYVNDSQLVTVEYSMVPEGKVTADFSTEGKTELKLDSLMKNDSKVMETLQQAAMPGLMGILQKAMQIMPDEINAIMQMLTPQESAVTESAGE